MNIVTFTEEHIAKARAIASINYNEERESCSILPVTTQTPDLKYYAENGLGVAAFEDEELVGFLCCYEPWEEAWDSLAVGTYSPIHAHGAVKENRERIYRELYEAAAKVWVEKGVTYHGIGLYYHDREAINAFFEYGFGKRCMDEIRVMDPIGASKAEDITFEELRLEDFPKIRDMRVALDKHLWKSPCFMVSLDEDRERWLDKVEQGDRRTFVAKDASGKYLAYLDAADEGENFVTYRKEMMNLQGAFCIPEYRGTGLMDSLLDFCISVLKKEGYSLLGVDHESFNPAALYYWKKHFIPYTASLVRRLDECALRK